MKTLSFLLLSITLFAPTAWAGKVKPLVRLRSLPDGSCQQYYVCPDNHPTPLEWDNNGNITACDPAFITYDGARVLLKSAFGSRSTPNGKVATTEVLTESIQRLAKALEAAKTFEQARAIACEAWRSVVPPEFQRHALAVARSLRGGAKNAGHLDAMLVAMDNPSEALSRCQELGRGNAAQKKLAAERLSLLLENPNLTERLK